MAATKLNCSNFTAAIRGIANKIYLARIEIKEIENSWRFDRPNFNTMDLAMTMKFSTLKKAPRINPLPTGLWPAKMNTNPTTTDSHSACCMIFFCNFGKNLYK